jgi:hypothetical protein
MSKYYFESELHEFCSPLSYFLDKAKENGDATVELFEAVPCRVPIIGWCNEYETIVESEDCGKTCEQYSPKNGKSGMCKHKSLTLFECGKKVKVDVKTGREIL